MLCTAPTLRTAAIGCRLQPTLLTPCTYHTSSPTPLRSADTSATPRRRVLLGKHNVSFKSVSQQTRRAASTTSTPPSSSQNPSQAQSSTDVLDWNTFFKLRKTRRWYQLGSSIGGGIGGIFTGSQILINSDIDSIVGQFNIDPIISLGLISFASGGLGWLVAPVLGNAVFNYRNRKFRAQMDAKETEFFGRVKKYRVDPAGASASNPVPDYYGEKISSVAGYRQWRKDQRAFKKKRETYV